MSSRAHRLLSTTALHAAALCAVASPAHAQLSPMTRPTGGQVVAGAASIATTPNATNIDQTSSRAAIDWQSFDVGSRQSVEFHQPSASAIILNRVTGPNPSAIAGRIDANGQVIITNPSGVVFSRGAQVNAQSLVVSAPGITNANLMAGRMVFDQQANPNARIVNRGTLTVRQAGLAAMVAPSVANEGAINARLGHVVLAGAATDTLDLYGDGLVSLDVSSQVRQVPAGPHGRPVRALVTNSGTIEADGGTVQLTAAAADGVIQHLVDARGTIRADTIGNRTGAIEIAGTGGSVTIEGSVEADGDTQGGRVAIGTRLTRPLGSGTFPTGTSKRTVIGSTAHISASARTSGRGGRVTILSTEQTTIAGTIAARGGASRGDGGTIELSGEHGFALTGHADASARHGALGSIILDPTDLTIVPNTGTTTLAPVNGQDPNIAYNDGNGPATVTEAAIEALTGNVHLQALDNLEVSAPLTLTRGATLELEAGNDLLIDAGDTVTNNGPIVLIAASPNIPGSNPAGAMTIAGNIVSTVGLVGLAAGTGGIALAGTIDAQRNTGELVIDTTGPFTEQGTAQIVAGDLAGLAADVSLLSPHNQIDAIDRSSPVSGAEGPIYLGFSVTAAAGSFDLSDSVPLTVGNSDVPGGVAVQPGDRITLFSDSISVLDIGASGTISTVLSAPSGTIVLAPYTSGRDIVLTDGTAVGPGLTLTTTELAGMTADALALGTFNALGAPTAGNVQFLGSIDLGSLGFSSLEVAASGNVSQTGPLGVTTFTGQAGTLSLLDEGNYIGNLDSFTTTAGTLALHSGNTLFVGGPLIAQAGVGTIVLSSSASAGEGGAAPGLILAADIQAGTLSLDSTNGSANGSDGILQTGGRIIAGTLTGAGYDASLAGANTIGALGTFTTFGSLVLTDDTALRLVGDVTSQAGTITLNAAGIAQPAGTLSAAELDLASTGNVTLTSAGNQIPALGTVALGPGSSFDLATASSRLFLTGPVTASAAHLVFKANAVSASGTATAIADPGGTVTFEPFTAGTTLGLFEAPTGNTEGLLLDQAFLDVIATATLVLGDPTAGAATIGGRGDQISLAGHASALFLVSGGSVTEGNGASLTVGTLDGVTGPAILGGDNTIGVLGTYAAPSLSLFDNQALTIAGPVSLTGAGSVTAEGPLTVAGSVGASALALDAAAGNLLLTGAVSSNTLELASSGSVAQTAGSIVAGTLTGQAASFSLTAATNAIGTLADLNATGILSLRDAGSLVLSGTLNASSATLDATGSITSAQVALIAFATLTGTASALSIIDSQSDAIGTLGNFTTTNGFSLTNGPFDPNALTVAGIVTDSRSVDITQSGSIAITGTVAAPAVTIAAQNLRETTGPVPIIDNGNLTLAAGGLVSGTDLSLSAGNALTLAPGSDVRAAAGGNVSLASDGAMLLAGTIAGPSVQLVATSDTITGDFGTTIDPGSITQTGGAILTGELTGSDSGSADFASATNSIDAIGPFRSVGGFILHDQAPTLAIAGTLIDTGRIELDAGAVAIGGTLQAPTIVLGATGSVTESGRILGETLSGIAGGLSLIGTNSLDILGTLTSTAGIAIDDAFPLTIVGRVTAGSADTLAIADDALGFAPGGTLIAPGGTVVLSEYTPGSGITLGGSGPPVDAATLVLGDAAGGPVTIDGSFDLAGVPVLDLLSAGTISETVTGSLAAATLDASGSDVVLNGANRIAALGSVVGTTGVSIVNGGTQAGASLAVEGPVSAVSGTVALTTYGTLLLAGDVSAPTIQLAADSTATVTTSGTMENLDGVIDQTAGTVTGATIGLVAADALIQNGAIVATASTGALALTSNGAMTLGGTLSGTTVSLVADTRRAAQGTGDNFDVVLGTIAQTGGTITAGTLVGGADGPVSLIGTDNVIGTLGDFAANRLASAGSLALSDSTPLTVAGLVTDSIAVALTTDTLAIAGTIAAPILTLDVAGAVTEPAGVLDIGTLTGNAGTIALLGSNLIGTLGALAGTSAVSIADAQPLAIAGLVVAGQGNALRIADDAPQFLPGGALSAPAGTIALAEFTPGRGITLGGGSGIAGDAPIDAGTLVVGDLAGGPVTIAGSFDLADIPVLDLLSAGAITEADGAGIAVDTLSASGSNIILEGDNQIATIGAIKAAGTVSITAGQADNPDSLLVGNVTAGTLVAITAYGTLTLAGTIAATNVALVADATTFQTLTADATVIPAQGLLTNGDGIIVQTGGTIAGADISLTAAGALIQTGGTAVATGSLAVSSNGPMVLEGTLAAPAVSLTNGPGLVTSVGDGNGGFDPGSISEPGGVIDAGKLTVTSSGPVALNGFNSITTLGPVASDSLGEPGGGFSVIDTGTLVVAGPLVDPIAVGLTAGALAIGGTIASPSLVLDVASAVTEPGGVLQVGTLDGTAGSLTLNQPTNTIGTLGALASAGTITIADATPVAIAGPVAAAAAGTLTIDDDALTFLPGGTLAAPGGIVALAELTLGRGLTLGGGASNPPIIANTLVLGDLTGGPLTITGTFDLTNIPVLDLLSAGAITEAGGALAIGTLEASGNAIDLGGANRIAALGTVTSATSLVLADGSGLAIAGPVSAVGSLVFDLAGAIAETGGKIGAGVLAGSASALDLSSGANLIAALGPFTTPGDLALNDQGSLAITGLVTAASLSLRAKTAVTEQTAGNLRATTLNLSAASVTLGGNNTLAALGSAEVTGALTLDDTADLFLTGPISAAKLDLTSTGSIAQTAGTLDVGTLTATTFTSASFGSAGIAIIGTLGNMSAGSSLVLADSTPLVIAGALSAPYLAISAVGSMILDGGSIATTGLPPARQSGAAPTAPGSFLQVNPGPDGSGLFTQIGTTMVSPLGGAPSTLRIGIPSDPGTLTLSDLVAPQTTIILEIGSGTATGTLDAAGLLVLGQGGSASLAGTINAIGGSDAAAIAGITPSPDILYEFNGCEIATGCLALLTTQFDPLSQPVAYSILRPDIEAGSLSDPVFDDDDRHRRANKTPLLTLELLDLAVGRNDDDATIQLPNISDRDY